MYAILFGDGDGHKSNVGGPEVFWMFFQLQHVTETMAHNGT